MLADEISRLCIKSADTYYKYLTDYNKGIQEIRVLAVEKKEDNYRLKLQKKAVQFGYIAFFHTWKTTAIRSGSRYRF